MKRLTSILLSIIFIITAATTAFAIYADDETGKYLIKNGYTTDDINSINGIILYSDASVVGLIVQKYEELGDWKKVGEFYNYDEAQYDNYLEGMARWQAVLDSVPENVMTAMKDEGWSLREINNFVNRINLNKIDFEYAWKQYKSGMTLEEIVQEKKEENQKISELDKNYIWNDMSETEYWTELSKIKKTDNATISEILMSVKQLRIDVRNRHKKRSGITDEEIAYCESQGMTNPMDMFQAKNISKGNNIPFEKVVETRLKNENWTVTNAELLNVSLDEYMKRNGLTKE